MPPLKTALIPFLREKVPALTYKYFYCGVVVGERFLYNYNNTKSIIYLIKNGGAQNGYEKISYTG